MPKRTAQTIEEKAERDSTQPNRVSRDGTRIGNRGKHPNSRAQLRPKPWPKGMSGNPGGKPGYDVAAKIARQIFELNQKAIYEGMAQEVIDGKPYAFDVVATRGFGKLKEKIEHSGDELLLTALALGRKRIASDE